MIAFMAAIVICGRPHAGPDLAVGPFLSDEEAEVWAISHRRGADRYAAVMALISPDQTA